MSQEGASSELRSRVVSGFAWSMGVVLTMQVSRIVVGLVLARLLTPHDYGLAAMALVFSSLVLALSDLSLGAGLVQRPRITETDRSTVFWTSAGIGLLLTIVGVLLAGPIASFYGQPDVKPLFAVLSLSFVITALATTQASLFQREMNFRPIGLRLMMGYAIGGAVGIAVAAMGFGAWALIAQSMAVSVVSTSVLWTMSSWRPSFTFSRESLHDLGGFGTKLLGTRLLDYVKANSDNILVGRFLGSAALGAYAVAYNIILLPIERLVVPVQETLFPAFSRLQDDRGRIAALWLRVTRFVAAIVVPAMLFLIIAAPDFITVVLGSKWKAAIPVVQILSVVALVQSLSTLGAKVLAAVDQTGQLLRFSLVRFALAFGAFVLGLHWGIVGVATCYAIVAVPMELLLIWLTARALDTSVFRFVRSIMGVLEAAGAASAAAVATRLALVHVDAAPALRLAAVLVVGAVVYLPIVAWREPEVITELKTLRARRRGAASAEQTSEALAPS